MTVAREAAGSGVVLLHAHPGHELRLFRWMEQHKPTLLLMTDGSGGGASRTHHSLATVKRAGAAAGDAFGLAADRDWYAAILSSDLTLFDRMIEAVVQTAVAERATLIVSDAVDGYNPMHDLCEAVAAAAVSALRRQGRNITHLVARAVAGGEQSEIVAEMHLGEAERLRKQDAINAYTPLAEEVRRLLEEDPTALYREQLRRPSFAWRTGWSPSWESVGASRVAASKYTQRIEYERHVRPLALALLRDPAAARVKRTERLDCAS